jgi:2-iminoacetate synthase
MAKFVSELHAIDASALRALIYGAKEDSVRRVLKGANGQSILSLEEMAALVSPSAAGMLEEMAQRARAITARRFGKTIQFYAPLYISNFCRNSCVYCGFNAGNRVGRRTLKPDEIMSEARLLHDRRIHQLLLVTGECPEQVSPAMLAEVVSRLQGLFPLIAVEVYPLEEDDYRRLVGAGADGLTIYQETYDRQIYLQVHPAGPKRNFDYRLEAPERGGRAGFRQIGIGSLLGLNDWRLEACWLYLHARFLMKHYWKSQAAISFPRLRPAAGGYQPPHPVSDRELVQMICALRLSLPDVGLVLSTRESPEFRDHMIGIGITKMSAGSRTSPGGYLDEQGPEAEEQFSVHDGRSVAQVAEAVRNRGYDPVWKDWDKGFV